MCNNTTANICRINFSYVCNNLHFFEITKLDQVLHLKSEKILFSIKYTHFLVSPESVLFEINICTTVYVRNKKYFIVFAVTQALDMHKLHLFIILIPVIIFL